MPLSYIKYTSVVTLQSGTTTDISTSLNGNGVIEGRDNLAKSFGVGQAVMTARDFAQDMIGHNVPNCSVRYPEDVDTSYYALGVIHLKEYNFVDNWDSPMHEFGHHIQETVLDMSLNGISHNTAVNDSVALYEDRLNCASDFLTNLTTSSRLCIGNTGYSKLFGCRLAWQESWPTAFAFVAQDYSKQYLTGIPTANDYYYRHDGRNYNGPGNVSRYGEACEDTLIGFLWNLYDTDPVGQFDDGIALGARDWWDITTKNSCSTFGEFVQGFYHDSYFYDLKSDFNYLLTLYRIAENTPVLSGSLTVDNPPTFVTSWSAPSAKADMENNVKQFRNNKFFLIIYDADGEEILRTAHYDSKTITLTTSEWNTIKKAKTPKFKVAVGAYQDSDPSFGYYVSGTNAYWVPGYTNSKAVSVSTNFKYFEDMAPIYAGYTMNYTFSFKKSYRIVFQTFGEYDTYMELFDNLGNTLRTDDNSGYNNNSLINYSCESGKTYTLRVRHKNTSESGVIKTTATPVYSGYSWYSSFDSLYHTNVSYSCKCIEVTKHANAVEILVVVPYYSGTYEFETAYPEVYADTMMYIVDPTTGTKAALVGDDETDDDQAIVMMNLVAGRPYYIILTSYNVADDNVDIDLIITKH